MYDERCGYHDHLFRPVRPVGRGLETTIAGFEFSVDIVGFNENNAFRMASALEVTYFTAWSGFANGRYSVRQI